MKSAMDSPTFDDYYPPVKPPKYATGCDLHRRIVYCPPTSATGNGYYLVYYVSADHGGQAMKTVKSKTLRAVEPHTKYMGCTFYLEGPHCLDDCEFDNCSFRGELHYVDIYAEDEYSFYPHFVNCTFPDEVTIELCTALHINGIISEEAFLLNMATTLIANPLFGDQESRLIIECALPKIKTIDLSAYESYSEIPVEWFKRFPTLEKVILPRTISSEFVTQRLNLPKNLGIWPIKSLRDEFARLNLPKNLGIWPICNAEIQAVDGYAICRKPLLNEKIVQDACSAANKWKSRKPAP